METFEAKLARVLAERVEIVPYDPRWPRVFEAERTHLLSTFPPGTLRRIEHFGSTAVPGLPAKPIVDLLIEVADLEEARRQAPRLLPPPGYDFFWRPTHGDDGPPFYAWLIKRDPASGERTHHLHLLDASFDAHWDRLLFRDYLIARPEVAARYAALKRRLAREFPGDREAYTEAKGAFIGEVTEQARKRYRPA